MLRQKKTENARLLPADVGQTHPRISVALSLRLYHLLDLLEWVEFHPAHVKPHSKYPKDKVRQQLATLINSFGDNAQVLQGLNKCMYYAALYLIEHEDDHEEGWTVLHTTEMVIEFFEGLYRQNVI